MKTKQKNRVGLVVPHIFIHRDILPGVIFSPGQLAIELCEQLKRQGAEVTLFAPGPVTTTVPTITADLTHFEEELKGRGDSYLGLLKKHPFTFISLARQVQAELIAKAYTLANEDKFDIIHIYTNEEETALPFAALCNKPVVFTHHDPFNFLVKYKNVFPKYKQLPWISMSYAQRRGMPSDTNWAGNVYHGLDPLALLPTKNPTRDYVAYLGRIIEPKGVHIAIQAVKRYNETAVTPLKLKIAGKHYTGHQKDTYWQTQVEPFLDDTIEYIGHIDSMKEKEGFLGNAKGLLVPSTFDEPFGMVTIEAMACDTPVIGLDSGAIPEIIINGQTGFVIEQRTALSMSDAIAQAIDTLDTITPLVCRRQFEERFTLERMAQEHIEIYNQEITKAAL
jgi:glycosyltransferase involved in cell wall biosynthesis